MEDILQHDQVIPADQAELFKQVAFRADTRKDFRHGRSDLVTHDEKIIEKPGLMQKIGHLTVSRKLGGLKRGVYRVPEKKIFSYRDIGIVGIGIKCLEAQIPLADLAAGIQDLFFNVR